MNTTSFFDNQTMSVERVILAEKITISDTTQEFCVGKFYFPIMTPTIQKSSPKRKKMPTPTPKIIGSKLKMSSYTWSNYIKIAIPRYIYSNFNVDEKVGKIVIPKGSKFLVTSINQSIYLEDIYIIGICGPSITENE